MSDIGIYIGWYFHSYQRLFGTKKNCIINSAKYDEKYQNLFIQQNTKKNCKIYSAKYKEKLLNLSTQQNTKKNCKLYSYSKI